jgi:copper chaperone NosL
MTTRARLLFVAAALVLAGAFVLPIWSVYLQAPQYPEGLGMHIRINTITGLKPNDLDNINNLNHYIGMKRIVPESIPELKVMPYLVGGLMAFGLLVAAVGRRVLARVWIGAFVVLAIVGLADFWKWEYDYGHDLDMENAIIKVPGMNYQPPLLGSKQLLNFTATSIPGPGGWLLTLSLALGVTALVLDHRARGAPARAAARAPAHPVLMT